MRTVRTAWGKDRRSWRDLGQVADELQADQINRGEQPDVEDFVRRYPEMATICDQVLPALQVMGPCSLPVDAGSGIGPPARSAGVRVPRRLPHYPRDRPRRHGRGVRGGADFAAAAGGAEGAAAGGHPRRTPAAPLPQRGAGGGVSAPRQHRARLCRGSGSRRPLLCHAADRGSYPCRRGPGTGPPILTAQAGRGTANHALHPHLAASGSRCRFNRGPCRHDGTVGPRQGILPRRGSPWGAGGGGTGLRPPDGRGASRHQAGQPDAGRPRQLVGHGLRPGPLPARRDRPDHDGRPGRHAPLHESGAGHGQARAGRSPHRHLLAGSDAVRAAGAAAGLFGRGSAGVATATGVRGPDPAAAAEQGGAGGAGNHRPQGAGEEPGRALRHGAGVGRRPAPLPGRQADSGKAADVAAPG